jgi:hypothetical protein
MKHMNNMSGDTDALGHREFKRPSLSRGALAGEAEILWDQFGIPHIYGPDVLTVARAPCNGSLGRVLPTRGDYGSFQWVCSHDESTKPLYGKCVS